ncbi:ABC transporter substrate-binding protein [Shouchella shacheensis]|uniref:ABC transporter substrate-binding protein n=1 Tax=Shouchella shacheensis TaxID=1649580 RepID=UPI0007400FAB|nr:iron-siderophore ABC transporter substrate-binding protein [Shouchella shacheensis]
MPAFLSSKFKTHPFPLLTTVVFSITLIGCSGQEEEATGENEMEESEDVVEVEHSMGTTEIEGTPERVVTLYQGATDTAVALGIEPVGVVESWVEQPIYNYLRNDLEGTEIVGSEIQPNLEEVANLEPDLIMATQSRHEEVYGQLSEIAPTVVADPIFDFKNTLRVMGQATNQQDEVEQISNDWDERVADFQEKMSEKMGEEWPLTASVLNFRSDQARVFLTGFPGSILEELGFARTDTQQEEVDNGTAYLELTSTESIPEMNADVIFLFTAGNQEDEEVQATYETWTEHPLWQDLDAVEEDQVYPVDEVTWNMGGGYTAANEVLDQLYERFDLDLD